MTAQEAAAREELRARQGKGARYDNLSAPHRDLVLARQGTAYFARLLANMNDRELDGPSRITDVSRREIVAWIGLEARLLAEAIAFVRDNPGQVLRFDTSPDADEVKFTATLPSQALRNLFVHSEVHLNVEWRDLDAAGWDAVARTGNGAQMLVRATPRIRARSLWHQAYQLGAGGRIADIPGELEIVVH